MAPQHRPSHAYLNMPAPHVKTIVGAFFEALWNMIRHPGPKTFYAFIGECSTFYFIPMVGGYLQLAMFNEYMQDSDTYNSMPMNYTDLYGIIVQQFNMKYWEVLGKVNYSAYIEE
eukprot:CAMPEP_0202962930 /NCGR_PEP_ID=MMETSP1396-20130829/6952_1 /ASSEMBLY_ACC=CAM_ASM_000872 /TAXON_ID= /ORGANISM="Pseudokeronopsis sp., Strain Brazil" /LENGTH=114 /DNA_ID=CAMNT_0049683769 /DNA_START=97 /DNA_END=441 /DNA_ORIENTATION=+